MNYYNVLFYHLENSKFIVGYMSFIVLKKSPQQIQHYHHWKGWWSICIQHINFPSLQCTIRSVHFPSRSLSVLISNASKNVECRQLIIFDPIENTPTASPRGPIKEHQGTRPRSDTYILYVLSLELSRENWDRSTLFLKIRYPYRLLEKWR